MRSYALFSDDQGLTWTAGQLLPAGWTEDQLAEMKNGSILMTSRLEGRGFPQWQPDPNNGTDPRNHRRGFARSDDGADLDPGSIACAVTNNTFAFWMPLYRWIHVG